MRSDGRGKSTQSRRISRDKHIALALSVWFDQHESDRNRWRTAVGKEIRRRLSEWGNFKRAPRGASTKPK